MGGGTIGRENETLTATGGERERKTQDERTRLADGH
jgi:hypothetical protein